MLIEYFEGGKIIKRDDKYYFVYDNTEYGWYDTVHAVKMAVVNGGL